MKINIIKNHIMKIINDKTFSTKMQTRFYYKNIQFIYTIKSYKSLFPQKWQTFMHMCLTAYEYTSCCNAKKNIKTNLT